MFFMVGATEIARVAVEVRVVGCGGRGDSNSGDWHGGGHGSRGCSGDCIGIAVMEMTMVMEMAAFTAVVVMVVTLTIVVEVSDLCAIYNRYNLGYSLLFGKVVVAGIVVVMLVSWKW